MFEQSYETLKMPVATVYGKVGLDILNEVHNKEILDIINAMSDTDLEMFYNKIEENFVKTETLINFLLRNKFLPEERFDYDSFYHTCYQKLDFLVNKGNKKDSKYLALTYNKLIKNIRSKIKSASDIKKYLTTTYEVHDEIKLNKAKRILEFKTYIENYFRKIVKECGFEVIPTINTDDIIMLVKAIRDGIDDVDVLSKLHFVENNEPLLKCLRNFGEEFKSILIELSYDENNNLVILPENFSDNELEIYLYVSEKLNNTKPVSEENLLDNIFNGQDIFLQKKRVNNGK